MEPPKERQPMVKLIALPVWVWVYLKPLFGIGIKEPINVKSATGPSLIFSNGRLLAVAARTRARANHRKIYLLVI